MRVFTFRLPPINKQQLLLLLIAIICLIGYLLLQRTNKSKDFSNYSPEHSSSDAIITDKDTSKDRASLVPGPSLTFGGKEFLLEGKPFRILSGAIHYFRVVPEYWKDRLVKLKAMGLNTVETYVAWNLHEEIKGEFKFDGNLDIKGFIELAQELGLYVILRPGPYICSEWDFGGLPSWLLNDPHMEPRSMYPPFVQAGDNFFKKLLPIVVPLQYSKGGPIIAFQIENEYGSYPGADVTYLEHLKMVMISEGVTELLFTSDNYLGLEREQLSVPNVLKTINFGVQQDAKLKLVQLKETQPDKPVMVTEYWLGWFDQWSGQHHVKDTKAVTDILEEILQFGASFNLYMFHGGTNFGFMNGANDLIPVTTSYDYDGPLSEAGDTTPKYHAIKAVIKQYAPEHSIPKNLSSVPPNSPKMDSHYGKVKIQQYMSLSQLLQYHTPVISGHPTPMEQLPINNNGGQGYGFILYQTELSHVPKEIEMEQVLDRAQVLLDSVLLHTYDASLGYKSPVQVKMTENLAKSGLKLPELKNHILEILVENMGRTNIAWEMKKLRKGISGEVTIDGQSHTKWRIYPLEFKQSVMSRIKEKGKWKVLKDKVTEGPALYKGTFQVHDEPKDTFLNMEKWTKGVCFINGHNLGRYWIKGPQQTLYLPAPWLKKGENELIIFELHNYKSAAEVSFSTSPVYK